MNAAPYICNRYRKESKIEIDEMKLQKLLYFSQRESLIQNNKALFNESFYVWKTQLPKKYISPITFCKEVPQDAIVDKDNVNGIQ